MPRPPVVAGRGRPDAGEDEAARGPADRVRPLPAPVAAGPRPSAPEPPPQASAGPPDRSEPELPSPDPRRAGRHRLGLSGHRDTHRRGMTAPEAASRRAPPRSNRPRRRSRRRCYRGPPDGSGPANRRSRGWPPGRSTSGPGRDDQPRPAALGGGGGGRPGRLPRPRPGRVRQRAPDRRPAGRDRCRPARRSLGQRPRRGQAPDRGRGRREPQGRERAECVPDRHQRGPPRAAGADPRQRGRCGLPRQLQRHRPHPGPPSAATPTSSSACWRPGSTWTTSTTSAGRPCTRPSSWATGPTVTCGRSGCCWSTAPTPSSAPGGGRPATDRPRPGAEPGRGGRAVRRGVVDQPRGTAPQVQLRRRRRSWR